MNWENKIENKRKVQQLSAVLDPQKVKVLILTDQKAVYTDFYFFTRFVNIVKLDLSYNKLTGFSVGFTFKHFINLRTLFLHYNKFASIKSVNMVRQCEKLQYLTLFGNPLQETKTRHYFINQIKSLKLMDDKIVLMQERNPQIMLKNNSQNNKLSFPIVSIAQSQNSAYFLSSVVAQLHFLRQKYLNANPIIKIQRWVRRKLKLRKKLKHQLSQKQMQDKIKQLFNEENLKTEKNSQRLVTQRLAIHVSHEERVLSLLQMNVQVLAFLRQKSKKKVFALKQFCEQHNLKYEDQSKKLLCLRVPQQLDQRSSNSQLQLIIKSSQKYLIRRKGSQISMNLTKKYPILQTLLKKRKRRDPKHFSSEQYQPNSNLQQKIADLQTNYSTQFVLLKQDHSTIYNCMKQQFYICKRQRKLFPFCLQQIMQRSAAAVSIQRMWRGYAIRKKLTNSYERITKIHAAWFIQRHIRSLAFRKRSSFLIQLTNYAKNELGSKQLIISMEQVQNLQKVKAQLKKAINFIVPDQKLNYWINSQNQLVLQKNQRIILPAYFNQYININKQYSSRQYQNQNILDLLFKGAFSVKYLSIPSNQNKPLESSRKQENAEKVQQAKNIENFHIGQNLQDKMRISRPTPSSTNYVIFQYKNTKQCLNRKFLLALHSYQMLRARFVKSQRFNLTKNSNNLIKNITERVNGGYFFMNTEQGADQQQNQMLSNRQSTNIKLKFFVQQEQFATKLKMFHPIQQKQLKKDASLSIPLKQLQKVSSIGGMSQRKHMRKQQSIARISRTIITIFPNEQQKTQSNFMSYRQKDKIVKSKLNYRYNDQYLNSSNQQKSLQKCQSLKPISKNEQSIKNQRTEKNFTTEAHLQSVTQKLRLKFKQHDNSFGYTSIDEMQLQNKKQKITFFKNTHMNKMEQTDRYKKQQMIKMKQKWKQELNEHAKSIQASKNQTVIANAKKHNMVKRALSKQIDDIKNFQRDFLKRGNSSIRKDLIKFQHDRSNHSPDNQSIYQSMKSLDSEILKHHLAKAKRSKQIFNLRTQIKQFSIDGSQGQADLSLVVDLNKKSKQLSKRYHEDKKQDSLSLQKRERIKNIRSNKKDMKKKKRLVHSVFPEQFYPLKQSKRLGFQLPKINQR